MGSTPWKLNNTGNQIGYSGRQCSFCQWIPNVIRKATNEHIDEKRKLLFRWLKDRTYTVYHGGNDDLERFAKRDICQLIREEEKDFSQGTTIFAPSLFHRDHEISGKNDSDMGCQCIIRKAMTFRNQLKERFTGLEKHLDCKSANWGRRCLLIKIGINSYTTVQSDL